MSERSAARASSGTPDPSRPTRTGPQHAGRPFDGAPRAGRDSEATLYTLESETPIVARVTDHGASLVELEVPDRDGRLADVVLGFDSVDGYRSPQNPYLGATIGRVANRIAYGRFSIGDQVYRLAVNEPPHHLHGGAARSFDKVRWETIAASRGEVVFRYRSVDGEEGYPGELEATAIYRLHGPALTIIYEATVDRTSPVNLTNHSYFNLGGHASGDILEHELAIDADRTTAVDAELLPTGLEAPVDGTALDLRRARPLGAGVRELASEPTLGYDHNYVLRSSTSGVRDVAMLRHLPSGRTMVLATDQPSLQCYSGNRLEDLEGKRGARYGPHGGLCLEPQYAPDSVNQPRFPSILLEPGRTYRHVSRYHFSVS